MILKLKVHLSDFELLFEIFRDPGYRISQAPKIVAKYFPDLLVRIRMHRCGRFGRVARQQGLERLLAGLLRRTSLLDA